MEIEIENKLLNEARTILVMCSLLDKSDQCMAMVDKIEDYFEAKKATEKLKQFTLIVKENGTGLTSEFKSIGFNEVEVIGAIERSKISILNNFLAKAK